MVLSLSNSLKSLFSQATLKVYIADSMIRSCKRQLMLVPSTTFSFDRFLLNLLLVLSQYSQATLKVYIADSMIRSCKRQLILHNFNNLCNLYNLYNF
jgi:hypothetical protein